jgi:pimeloyl-ACP methyl ester carboxylesterase
MPAAPRKGISWAAAIAIAALATACGGSDATSARSPSPTTSATPADPYHARAELLDIGGGHHVYMECAGVGTPTVLLESGDESDNTQWRQVFPTLVDHTRVCRYDRLGTGASDPATGCRQVADLRGVLEAALRVIGEKGPYVLVGTSGGGYLMAGFAYAHPPLVRGVVLVETPHAIVLSEAPAELRAQLRCDAPTNVERRDYARVENDVWSHRHRVGDLPMTVISNDYRGAGENAEQRTNVAGQKGWLVLSPQAHQVVVTTGHNVPENEPAVVIREILRILAAARVA